MGDLMQAEQRATIETFRVNNFSFREIFLPKIDDENNRKVLKILEKNCETICSENQYKIIEENIILSSFSINFKNISLIYIDPPYEQYTLNKLLLVLSRKIEEKTIIIIETSINDIYIIPEELKLITKKKYGKTNISFLTLS